MFTQERRLKLLYSRTGLTASTTGTKFDLGSLVEQNLSSHVIYLENTGSTNDIFVGFDQEIADTKTDGTNKSFRVRPNSEKSRPVNCKKLSVLTASSTSTYDIEVWG